MMSKNKSYKKIYLLSLVLLSLCFSIPSWCQQGQKQEVQQEVKVKEAAREELHRYMGYEDLLPKYISLPYDVVMNTNVQGPFIDIGYLLLLILPIILLLLMKPSWVKLAIMFLLFIFYSISASHGYCASKKIPISNIDQALSAELNALSFSDGYINYIKLSVLKIISVIAQPLNNLLANLSGEGDSITYPFTLLVFIVAVFLISRGLSTTTLSKQVMVYFSLAYGFLWWLLSAGVIWYGILLLPIGFIFIVLGIKKIKEQALFNGLWISLSGMVLFWIFLSLTSRLANYNPKDVFNSRGAINTASLLYGAGRSNEKEVMDMLYPNFNTVLQKVNTNQQGNVYRTGTFFHYFIDNNDTRVLADNQLMTITSLIKTFPNRTELTEAFKRSGYKYFLVDLNLATIDNTPDKTLTRKAEQLNQFLMGNPKIRLIATDRIMLDANKKPIYTIYGQPSQLYRSGTFAAFEII